MTVMQARRESRLGSVKVDPAFMIGEEIAGRVVWGEGKQRTRIPEVSGQDAWPRAVWCHWGHWCHWDHLSGTFRMFQ